MFFVVLQAAVRTPTSAQRHLRKVPDTEPAWGMRARRTTGVSPAGKSPRHAITILAEQEERLASCCPHRKLPVKQQQWACSQLSHGLQSDAFALNLVYCSTHSMRLLIVKGIFYLATFTCLSTIYL